MESNEIQQYFNEKVTHFQSRLEGEFLRRVENTDSEDYSYEYYREIIFENNRLIPWDSFFFKMLLRTFLHYYHTSKDNCAERTLEQLAKVQQRGEDELQNALELEEGMEANLTSDDVAYFENEVKLLNMENHEIFEYLAFYVATRILLSEYPKKNNDVLDIMAPLSSPKVRSIEYRETFTQRQQVLSLYFLFHQMGIKMSLDYNKTDLARFAHLLARHPISDINHSGLYKLIKGLYSDKSKDQNLKDLKLILPYFEKLQLESAATAIKGEILELEKNSKNTG